MRKVSSSTSKGKVFREFKIVNAEVLIRSRINIDDFIDCIEGNKKYLPAITCLTKIDAAEEGAVSRVKKELNADIAVSAEKDTNIEALKELIFEKLNFIRIYMKEPGRDADLQAPLIIFKNASIGNICNKLHKDFVSKFKYARVWGQSAKHPGIKVGLKHILKDKDILEVHLS